MATLDRGTDNAAILKDKKAATTTVRELRAGIERELHLDLTNAPFDPQWREPTESAR